MAFIPVANTAQVTMQYLINDSDVAENTFGVHNTGTWDASHLETLAAVFNTWNDTAVGGFAPYQVRSNSTTLVQTTARDLTTQTSNVVVVAYPGSHAVGTDTSQQLSNGVCKAFTARSGLSGRSQRGRIFSVGIAQEQISTTDPNQIISSYLNVWTGCLNALITDISTANAAWSLVVISRYHNGAPRGAGQVTPITTWGYANNLLDYQRRRAPGHGRHH